MREEAQAGWGGLWSHVLRGLAPVALHPDPPLPHLSVSSHLCLLTTISLKLSPHHDGWPRWSAKVLVPHFVKSLSGHRMFQSQKRQGLKHINLHLTYLLANQV